MSKSRKLEIENPEIVDSYRNKISGFNTKNELDRFLMNEVSENFFEDDLDTNL
jgi:site-specific DNA-methyltransferase (adenine-specific)